MATTIKKEDLAKLLRIGSDKVKLVKGTGSSEVWQQFKRVQYQNEHTLYAACNGCKKLYQYKPSTGTGSLSGHRCIGCNEEPPSKQRKLDHYISASSSEISKAKTVIADAAAMFCARDLRPFSVLEGD
ncbi:hypothetical protein B4U80_05500 [Leptotrombidium deliense]|uniref:BED-type domain-containing protein n=1 Tax=Leptotrombidium deliense TaxID=299467 RepID=A0A443S2F3_9ACAR|nr:hypothetical protein B4U80_05500 [Leptotrombidium deliense]